MPTRSERRQAEHLRRKLAYQLRQEQTTNAAAQPAESPEPTKPTISEAQLTANRANAQLSCGPVTSEGKLISSQNALKTGLTGRTVLLPTDDTSEYQRRLDSALTFHNPITEEEQTLVHSIVDIDWRLDRIVSLETGIYIKGTIEFADKFKDQTPAHRKILIQAETYLKFEKSLRNLHIQESRLQRQRTKNIAELKRLKEERTRRELALKMVAQRSSRPASVRGNGFEFSTDAFTLDAGLDQPEAPATNEKIAGQSA